MRTIRIGTEEMLYRRLNAMFSRGTVFSIITTLLIVLGFASVSWARDVPVKVAVFLKDPPWERKVPGEAILEMLDAVEWIDAEYIYDFKKATLEDYDVLVLCQTRYHPKQKPEGWMDVLRNWVRDGHGLLVTHDAVGYRRNKPFFPNISKGTGNPYNTMEPYSTECCVARSHPVTADFVPMQRFVLSFYDFITIDPGSEGVVVVRGVDKLGDGAVSSAPVVVCAEVGKGRYVANGAYLGGLAPSGKAVQPVGAERKLLLNCIEYLAHRSPGKIEPQDSADTGDIGNGIYLGPAAIDMLENGSFENAVAGTLPPGWSVCGPSESTKAVIVSANPHSGRNCVRLSVSSKAGESDKEMHPGIVIGNMNGGEWPEVYPVFPETSYALSFWTRGSPEANSQPSLRVSLVKWSSGKAGKQEQPLVPEPSEVVAGEWRRHEVSFTPLDADRMALAITLNDRNGGFPEPGVEVCFDDFALNKKMVKGLQGISTEKLLDACEKRIAPAWHDSMSEPAIEVAHILPGTDVEFPAAFDKCVDFEPLPEGWKEIDLSGLWKIRKLEDTEDNPEHDNGAVNGFWKADFDDSKWAERPVPSYWDNTDSPTPHPSGELFYGGRAQDFTGVGWYRHEFMVPATFAKDSVVLRFRGSDYETTVYLNGTKIGTHTGGDHPFEFDVTKSIRPGKTNVLAVRVYDESDRYHIDQSGTRVGGLYNKVMLQARPPIYARDLLVSPDIEKNRVEIETCLVNGGNSEKKVDLIAVVSPWPNPLAEGKGVETVTDLGQHLLKPGTNTLHLTAPLDKPVYWSDTNPFLYVLRLKTGEEVIAQERFGFREFKRDGKFFMLNGKPVRLRGVVFRHGEFYGRSEIEIENKNQAMRRYLLALKAQNMNTIMPQGIGTTEPRLFYDICDEIGMLVFAWPAYVDLGDLSDPDKLKPWLWKRYNHPCHIMTMLGNETRNIIYKKDLDAGYGCLKEIDGQKRPICSISGGAPGLVTVKTDVEDCHAYPGDIAGHPIDMEDIISRFNEEMWRFTGKNLPVINWEMGGDLYSGEPKQVEAARAALLSNPVDKQKLIDVLEEADSGYRMPLGVRWLSMYGIRRYVIDDYDTAVAEGRIEPGSILKNYDHKLALATTRQCYTARNQIEGCRRLGDLKQGYGMNLRGFAMFEIKTGQGKDARIQRYNHKLLPDGTIVTKVGFDTYRRCNNPKFICLNVFDRNVFSGRTLDATVYAINDTSETSKPWSIRAVIRNAEDKRLADSTMDIGTVEPAKRKLVPYEWRIPEKTPTGFYTVNLFLVEAGKIVSDNSYSFFVMNSNELDRKITCGKKHVAVYDVGQKYSAPGARTTCDIMDDLGMEYARLENLDNLKKYDVLVIGANSADKRIRQAHETIRNWLANGGRLVQYEQRIPDKIPYIPQLSVVKKYGHPVADILVINHPVFDGINHVDNWRVWNGRLPEAGSYGKQGGIFSALIGPLNTTALAVGCMATPRASDTAVQMLISEVKVGKGVALLSQAEATRRYGSDSVATRYFQNTLKYILSDDTSYATPLNEFVVKNVDYRRCGYIDMKGIEGNTTEQTDTAWADAVEKGIPECGDVRFATGDSILVVDKDTTIDVGKTMRLMAPEWEAEKQKTDTDQRGLELSRAETLYFLHSVSEGSRGDVVGSYTIVFKDGTRVEEQLIVGNNIGPASGKMKLENGLGVGNGFYVSRWMNPHTTRDITEIHIGVAKKGVKINIAGITALLTRQKVHD